MLYGCWRELFLLVIGRYSMQSHVVTDAAAPDPDSLDWARMNCIVRTWITGTITLALAETMVKCDASARVNWLGIES